MTSSAETAAYERRARRERLARREAERLLEAKAAELYELNASLEELVARRTGELVAARDAAIEASHAKGDFLARMSHEIRTPMHAMIGTTEYLLLGKAPPHIAEGLRTIQSAADSLLQLINDILDFSKIEADALRLSPVEFVFAAQIRSVVELMRAPAEHKGLELTASVDPALRGTLVGDESRLRQVLLNLVGNAIKFSAKGGVEVRASLGETKGDEVRVDFIVADTGVGIPADALDTIFDSFEQLESSWTRAQRGTGLGLAICRRLVAMFGGEISVQSEVGVGSEFRLSVWLQRCAKPDVPLPAWRALVFGVDSTTEASLRSVLSAADGSVLSVQRSVPALDVLFSHIAGRAPIDAIVADEHALRESPDVLAALTSLPGLAGLPVAMIDGRPPQPDTESAFDLDWLRAVGPLSEDAAEDTIRSLAQRVGATPNPGEHQEPAARVRSAHILVVDDFEANRSITCRLLERRGYTTETARDGSEALAAVTANEYDVVLMDVQMPGVNGIDATRKIRRWEADNFRHTPIVGFSAGTQPEEVAACKRAGMDGYLTKPLKATDLFEAIEEALASQPSQPRCSSPDKTKRETPTGSNVDERLRDPDVVAILGDDHDLVRDVLRVFLEEGARRTRVLEQPDDLDAVASVARQIKGGIAAVLRPDLRVHAIALEDAIAGSMPDVPGLQSVLRGALRDALAEFRAFVEKVPERGGVQRSTPLRVSPR